MKRVAFVTSMCLLLTTFTFCFSAISTSATDEILEDVLTEEAHNACLSESLSGSTTYASSLTEYDSFLVSYFDNLTYNFGVNYKGSCGYVALAMLLSYYDTYLNDEIIPEEYDINSIGESSNMIERRNSPGTMRDFIANPVNNADVSYGRSLTASEYYTQISSLQNVSLHSKLIMIGASKGYYTFSDNSNPAGTYFYQRYNVLIDYLGNVANISSGDYGITYINHESDSSKSNLVRQFAINQVVLGNPVLLSVRGGSGGHVVIAYDYDSETDELYCHMGWGANKTHVTPESQGFSIYKTALVIDFDLEHSHPLNYGVTTIVNNIPSTEYYCGQSCEIITYSEEIDTSYHNIDILPLSPTEHICECHCGYVSITSSHNITYSYYNSTQHYEYCSECAYAGAVTHEYTNFLSYTSTSHQIACACGETITEAHYAYRYKKYNNSLHTAYCICGKEWTEPHVVSSDAYDSGNRFAPCLACGALVNVGTTLHPTMNGLLRTENGSFILPDGIIVLVDEDIEAYFAGTLEFYYPDDNLETE